ncbi:SdrD B-like domain-containing protein [Curtobacterium sp. MCBD17_032]|uniref:SdrD B-like domain-containing protein n=1 Tax=Curtobacterium sp. MCBD17_032 TaxID=2175659 RepID=UPI000DA7CCEB|nr:SdrD B-like domain-containing protein [Curtobacterium sp. MCBD17_032]PZE86267.1 hypothetical protein DEI91_03960 [Curtobacterium sp. MCBD17_032]
MRPHIPLRTALTAVTAVGLALTAATPTWAVASTAPTTPAAARADAATDAVVGLAIEVAEDGNGPFTPEDVPGGDTRDDNGVVRTLDSVTYRVTMNSTGGPSAHERFTLTAPAGTSWAGVPGPCTGGGSMVSGQDLTCDLGTIAEGHAIAVPAVLDVSADLRNGDEIRVTGTGTADEAENDPVSATSPTTVVSAAARYDLSKKVQASVLRTDVPGPGGARGIQLVYPIAVAWRPVVPGQGLVGFEKSAGPMTFTDDVSQILGGLPSGARLWNGDEPACGPLSPDVPGLGGLPAGTGGGAGAVADSGTFTCRQSAPGQDVDVTIAGTVTDPDRMPTENEYGGPIAGGEIGYVVSGYISFWMPTPPDGTNVRSVNRYTPLQTTSVSGAPNYPGGVEPTDDNVSERNIVEFADGSGGKWLYRVVGDGAAVRPGSARHGDPWTTPGARLRSDVAMENHGLTPYRGAVLCDTFDRATQRLSGIGGSSVVAGVSGLTDARVQYAAYAMTSPAEGQQHTCDDADGPWYDSPRDVPGGIGAVGAVRAVGDLRGGESATLHSWVTVLSAPDGTRAVDFGHLSFGAGHHGWVHDTADPALGVGVLTDSVVITEDLARITKKTVDTGHDAADTPDKTSATVPGGTVEYALYPTLTNGNARGRPTDVTVRDTLPLHTAYVPDSASVPPAIDTVRDPHGDPHQRLTWTMHDVQPNVPVPPITYRATVSSAAPAGPIRNQVEIASPADASDLGFRQAERALQVVTTAGVGVEERAVEPVVVVGDQLRWELDYTDTDAEPARDVDLIDVLPDPAGADDGTFHGRTTLAGPVPVDVGAGETVRYTAAAPADVSLDGDDASNRPGGSTVWCAEADFGHHGCPGSLRDVTAFRITRSAPVPPGTTVTHTLALTTEGEHDGDTYANRFGLRSANLTLDVRSNCASIRVVAGAIGDRVWSDLDGDGLQDPDEPGVRGVDVRLTGTDDDGHRVDRRTTTDADGRYHFGRLRPGAYVVAFAAPDGRHLTREHIGDDDAIDSDAGPDGRTATVTLGRRTTAEGVLHGVERTTSVDAGLLPDEDAGGGGGPDGPDGPGTPGAGTGSPGEVGPGGRHDSSASADARHPERADGSAGPGRGDLAFTGAAGLPVLVGVALLLLSAGAAIVVARRDRVRVRRR